MNRLRCLLTGHPEWRETTIIVPAGTFGQQYSARFGVTVEVEASIFHGRAWRCVRCHAGRVTEKDDKDDIGRQALRPNPTEDARP